MSDEIQQEPGAPADQPRVRLKSGLWLIALVAAAIVGGLVTRGASPDESTSSEHQTTVLPRPIVQIVRQPTVPSIADMVDRLCPAIAAIVPAQAATGSAHRPAALPAFAVSANGWLVTAATLKTGTDYTVRFSDGDSAPIEQVRSDPVSGLSAVQVDTSALTTAVFANQLFARVGDFGFLLTQGAATDCAAEYSMIGSDFVVDGAASNIYERLQPGPSPLAPGSPVFAGDGTVIGVITDADGTLLPAPIASVIADELIRDDISPVASFGFRAVDLTPDLAARIGDARLRGAGVALVQPKSAGQVNGLRAGDVVIAVDDQPISSASELSRALDAIDRRATLRVQRGDTVVPVAVARAVPKAA